jgi:hypothetical protein
MRPFTVDEFHRLIDAHILTEDDHVELLEGWLVEKLAHHPPHDCAVELAQDLLPRLLPPGWRVRFQSAITLGDSEPEPDGAVVRGDPRNRAAHHPGPGEIALVLEISDSSLASDRREKARIYARAGLPIYWILNLVDRQLEIHTDPDPAANPPQYRHRQIVTADQAAAILLPGHPPIPVAVRDLLP